MQVGSATSSFLASLQDAGIAIPQGVVIEDRIDRDDTPATVQGASVVAAQHSNRRSPCEVVGSRRLLPFILLLR